MPELLRMPEVLANATEAVLQTWTVAPGAPFAVGDVIATVETEKAVVDVESDRDGVILVALSAEGAEVAVGAPIAVVGDPGDEAGDVDALLASLGLAPAGAVGTTAAAPAPAAGAATGTTGATGAAAAAGAVPGGAAGAPSAAAAASAPGAGLAGRGARGRIFSSPLARRLAKEHGLDIATLNGSGPNGRIMRRDVDAAARAITPPAAPATAAPAAPAVRGSFDAPGAPNLPRNGAYTDEPHTRMRRAIARRLTESKQQVPHFSLRATCQVDRLVALRAEVNQSASPKVSLNDFVVKAAARALRDVPALNVIWTDDAVRHFEDVDIAVAVASERGLMTPVLRGVDRRTVSDLAAEVRALRARAGDGTLRQDELEGGSLSITNLGMYGTEEFTAIINPPQAAILAVGAVRSEPVAVDGEVRVASVMTVTLSVDHRPVDGVVAARWLAAFVAAVEDPVRLLV